MTWQVYEQQDGPDRLHQKINRKIETKEISGNNGYPASKILKTVIARKRESGVNISRLLQESVIDFIFIQAIRKEKW